MLDINLPKGAFSSGFRPDMARERQVVLVVATGAGIVTGAALVYYWLRERNRRRKYPVTLPGYLPIIGDMLTAAKFDTLSIPYHLLELSDRLPPEGMPIFKITGDVKILKYHDLS